MSNFPHKPLNRNRASCYTIVWCNLKRECVRKKLGTSTSDTLWKLPVWIGNAFEETSSHSCQCGKCKAVSRMSNKVITENSQNAMPYHYFYFVLILTAFMSTESITSERTYEWMHVMKNWRTHERRERKKRTSTFFGHLFISPEWKVDTMYLFLIYSDMNEVQGTHTHTYSETETGNQALNERSTQCAATVQRQRIV